MFTAAIRMISFNPNQQSIYPQTIETTELEEAKSQFKSRIENKVVIKDKYDVLTANIAEFWNERSTQEYINEYKDQITANYGDLIEACIDSGGGDSCLSAEYVLCPEFSGLKKCSEYIQKKRQMKLTQDKSTETDHRGGGRRSAVGKEDFAANSFAYLPGGHFGW
jgi:hypothetical protein